MSTAPVQSRQSHECIKPIVLNANLCKLPCITLHQCLQRGVWLTDWQIWSCLRVLTITLMHRVSGCKRQSFWIELSCQLKKTTPQCVTNSNTHMQHTHTRARTHTHTHTHTRTHTHTLDVYNSKQYTQCWLHRQAPVFWHRGKSVLFVTVSR